MAKKAKDFTTDFIDINWVIDHVKTLEQRIDVLKKLGYKIGYEVYINEEKSFIKSIKKGKKNDLRIQISNKIKNYPLIPCVILEDD